MFDVLVRMVDTQGKEVLPSEFMAAAERNDLLKNIDRWVVRRVPVLRGTTQARLPVRALSKETAKDATFVDWLDNHVRSSRAEPQRLCFQVTEQAASSYITEIRALAAALRKRGFRFAIEGFRLGPRTPRACWTPVPLDFVKIDGAIVQGLTGDPQLHSACACW